MNAECAFWRVSFTCQFLAACAAGVSEPAALPALAVYPAPFQARAADELDRLPPPCPLDAPAPDCSALRVLIEDYGALRAAVRAGR